MTQPKTKKTARYILTAYHNTDGQLGFMEVVLTAFIRAQNLFFSSRRPFVKCSVVIEREDGEPMQTEEKQVLVMRQPPTSLEPTAPPPECSDPELTSSCNGCTDPHSEGTHCGCTKQHGHVGCNLAVPGKYDFRP